MRLELPFGDGTLENPGGDSQTHQASRPRVRFHTLCHTLLSRSGEQLSVPAGLPQFSLVMVLLGMTSVALDLLKRQHDPFLDTKTALSRLGAILPAVYDRLLIGPDGSMKRRGQAIYHITVIALSTPMEDLEKAANDGFSRQGRTPKQHTRAALIRLLTRQKVGTEPARHALQLLALYLTATAETQIAAEQSPAGVDIGYSSYTPYETSALYLACLTLWAFIIGRVGDSNDLDAQFSSDAYLGGCDLDEQESGDGLSPSMTTSGALLDSMAMAIDRWDMAACQTHWRNIVQRAAARLASKRNSNAQEYSQVLRSLSEVQSF